MTKFETGAIGLHDHKSIVTTDAVLYLKCEWKEPKYCNQAGFLDQAKLSQLLMHREVDCWAVFEDK